MRVGIPTEAFKVPNMSDEVRNGVYNAACKFFGAVGATISEVSMPLHAQGPAIWTAATRMGMGDWACQSLMPGLLSYVPPHVAFR